MKQYIKTNFPINARKRVQSVYCKTNQSVTLTINGYFTFSAASDFRDAYQSHPISPYYFLDLAKVTHYDSAALGCILVLYEFVNNENNQAHLTIQNASHDMMETFKDSKIAHLIHNFHFHPPYSKQ